MTACPCRTPVRTAYSPIYLQHDEDDRDDGEEDAVDVNV